MGFAPMENPQIAICVYVENGGWGATFGVPIGALMMEQFIRGHLSPESEARALALEQKHLYASSNEGELKTPVNLSKDFKEVKEVTNTQQLPSL